MNILNKFNIGLKKTSNFLTNNLIESFKSNKIEEHLIDEIETILISSDMGLEVTSYLIEKIKSKKIKGNLEFKAILNILSDEISQILFKCEKKIIDSDILPITFLFVGVNGSGKTTTIGKIIKYISEEKKILVAACDTFRAAAVDQLREWSNSKNTDFFSGKINQDPTSVAYKACEKVKNEKYDYLFIDTAGRLSNNTNLLNQLVKMKSAINKSFTNFTVKTILVLDGTNGSNMNNQVEIFGESLDVAGLIITKLDGTAKGGALISIAKKFEIPIHFVGVGEKEGDLLEFNAKNFSKSLLNIEN